MNIEVDTQGKSIIETLRFTRKDISVHKRSGQVRINLNKKYKDNDFLILILKDNKEEKT